MARDQGLEFYDLPMSACRRPTRRELLVLLDLFEHCRYPLLIHCKSGSDRTGLACALYLMSRRGEPPGWAVREFTLRHGHVPLFGPEHLHEPFREYEAWLEARGLDHSPARFRDWVEHDYQADDLATNIPRLPPGPRVLFEVDKGAKRTPGSGTEKDDDPREVSLRGWGWKTRSGGASRATGDASSARRPR